VTGGPRGDGECATAADRLCWLGASRLQRDATTRISHKHTPCVNADKSPTPIATIRELAGRRAAL